VHEHNKTIDLHAAVVMPDHIHLIFTPLVGPDLWTFTLPQIMRAIKGRAARKVNVFLNRRGPVWQDESFDHVLRSNESLAQKMDYVCQNPIRAGLVGSHDQYKWIWKGAVPLL
jgi:REP element-mobilizing transposase RayT